MYTYPQVLESIFSLKDIIIGVPILILIMWMGAIYARLKYSTVNASYFNKGLFFHLCSSLAFTILCRYYYEGDTIMYFQGALQIAHSDVSAFIDFMIHLRYEDWQDSTRYFLEGPAAAYFMATNNSMVGKIAAIPALLLGGSYISVCGLFSWLGFLGSWKIYKVFVSEYPHLHKPLAYGILFFPSLIYWTSSLLKDPLTLFGIGLLIEGTYCLIVERRINLKISLKIIIGALLVYLIKAYILISLFPALTLWILRIYNVRIRNRALRVISVPIFVMASLALSFVLIGQTTSDKSSSIYSLDSVFKATESQQNVFGEGDSQTESQKQFGSGKSSYFSIGNADGTIVGTILLFPSAINAALFRPYLWEVTSPFMLLAAIENLILFWFTIATLYRNGFKRTFKMIISRPILLMSILFTIIFAGMVGISTPNFGALSRYRIPVLPFYTATLIIVRHALNIQRGKVN